MTIKDRYRDSDAKVLKPGHELCLVCLYHGEHVLSSGHSCHKLAECGCDAFCKVFIASPEDDKLKILKRTKGLMLFDQIVVIHCAVVTCNFDLFTQRMVTPQ